MNATEALSDKALADADTQAVFDAFAEGRPVDPEIAQRVRERSERITAEIYRVHGLIDDDTFQSLLADDDEDL